MVDMKWNMRALGVPAVALLLGSVAGVSWVGRPASTPNDVVTASELKIVDAEGIARIVLSIEDGGGLVRVFGSDGLRAIQLGLDPFRRPYTNYYSGGEVLVSITSDPTGNGAFVVRAEEGVPLVAIGASGPISGDVAGGKVIIFGASGTPMGEFLVDPDLKRGLVRVSDEDGAWTRMPLD